MMELLSKALSAEVFGGEKHYTSDGGLAAGISNVPSG
jgi:hypothetical protein